MSRNMRDRDFKLLLNRRSFAPSSIFGVSDKGFAYDPLDLTKLKQVSDGSGSVTANGDPIGYIEDVSGKGNHATQATAGSRGVLDGSNALLLDGTDDHLILPAALLTGWTAGTFVAAVRLALDPPVNDFKTGPVFGDFGNSGFGDAYPFSDGIIYDGTLSNVRKITGNPAASLTAWHILTIFSAANDYRLDLNSTNHYTTAANTVAVGAAPLLGKSIIGGNTFLNGRIGRSTAINRILSGTELVDLRSWAASPYGIVL